MWSHSDKSLEQRRDISYFIGFSVARMWDTGDVDNLGETDGGVSMIYQKQENSDVFCFHLSNNLLVMLNTPR